MSLHPFLRCHKKRRCNIYIVYGIKARKTPSLLPPLFIRSTLDDRLYPAHNLSVLQGKIADRIAGLVKGIISLPL